MSAKNEFEELRQERDHWRRAAKHQWIALPSDMRAEVLRDWGIIVQGENAVIVPESDAARSALDSAYMQGWNAAAAEADQTVTTWLLPAQKLQVELAAILNFVTGFLSLMFGRDLEPERVIATFERPTLDLLDFLHRADIFNRRFRAVYGSDAIGLSHAIGLRELMANAVAAAQNKEPVNAEALLTELRALRHPSIIDLMGIIRAANKPGEYAPYTEWIAQRGFSIRHERGLTWDQTAEALITELEAMPYRPPNLEEGLKLLRSNRDQGRHGEYVKTTCKNRGKDQRVNGLTRTR